MGHMGKSEWGSITKRETKQGAVWVLRFLDPRKGGNRTSRKLGFVKHMTKTQAKQARDAIRRSLERVKPTLAMTFREFLTFHAEAHKQEAPASHESTYQQFEHVADYFGDKAMSSIVKTDAKELVTHMLSSGWKFPLNPNTVRGYVWRLRSVWDRAYEYGVVASNPFRRLKVRRGKDKDINAMTAPEVDRLIAACPPYMQNLIRVIAETGLRRGEALALTWGDVREGRVYVQQSKTGRTRSHGLSKRGAAAFAAIPRPKGTKPATLIFPGILTDKAEQAKALRHLTKACKAAGLKRITIHGLRHGLGYRLAAAGATEVEIANVLGHTNLATTRRYMDHHKDASSARAIGKLDAAEAHEPKTLRATDSGSN